MKPLTGKQANWLLFHEGEDSIEERGNKDDGYEVYRHPTKQEIHHREVMDALAQEKGTEVG